MQQPLSTRTTRYLIHNLIFYGEDITFEYELKTKIDLRLILPVRKFKIQSSLIR